MCEYNNTEMILKPIFELRDMCMILYKLYKNSNLVPYILALILTRTIPPIHIWVCGNTPIV